MEIISKPKQSTVQARKIYFGNQNIQLIDQANLFIIKNIDQDNVSQKLLLPTEVRQQVGEEEDLKAIYINSTTGENNLKQEIDVVDEITGKVIHPSNIITYNSETMQYGYNMNDQFDSITTYQNNNDIKNANQDSTFNAYKTSNDIWQNQQDARLNALENLAAGSTFEYQVGEYVFVWNSDQAEVKRDVIKAYDYKTLVNTHAFLITDDNTNLFQPIYSYPYQDTVTTTDLKIIPLPTCFLAGNSSGQYYVSELVDGQNTYYIPYKQFSSLVYEYQVNLNTNFKLNSTLSQITSGYTNSVHNTCLFQKGIYLFQHQLINNKILKFDDYELLPLNLSYYLCYDDILSRYGLTTDFNWHLLKIVNSTDSTQNQIYGHDLKVSSFNTDYSSVQTQSAASTTHEVDLGITIYICLKVVNLDSIIKYVVNQTDTFTSGTFLTYQSLTSHDQAYFEDQIVFATKNNQFDFRCTAETKQSYFEELQMIKLSYINLNNNITYKYTNNSVFAYKNVFNNAPVKNQLVVMNQQISNLQNEVIMKYQMNIVTTAVFDIYMNSTQNDSEAVVHNYNFIILDNLKTDYIYHYFIENTTTTNFEVHLFNEQDTSTLINYQTVYECKIQKLKFDNADVNNFIIQFEFIQNDGYLYQQMFYYKVSDQQLLKFSTKKFTCVYTQQNVTGIIP